MQIFIVQLPGQRRSGTLARLDTCAGPYVTNADVQSLFMGTDATQAISNVGGPNGLDTVGFRKPLFMVFEERAKRKRANET